VIVLIGPNDHLHQLRRLILIEMEIVVLFGVPGADGAPKHEAVALSALGLPGSGGAYRARIAL
jgi:hypothetical protein